MKVKTADLIDLSLDWAVAVAEGATRIQLYEYNGRKMIRVSLPDGIYAPWEPSRYWGQGGPIIDRECMDILCLAGGDDGWQADKYLHTEQVIRFGSTPLIAAMRCFVASRLGDEVDIPEELLT